MSEWRRLGGRTSGLRNSPRPRRARTRQGFGPIPSSGRAAGAALPALLFGLPLLGCGIWVFATMALMPIVKWRSSQHWSSTSCRVVELSQVWNVDKTIATVTPRYVYQVEGQSHEGTRYDFGNHRFDADEVAALVSAFPPASDRTCYVDPDDPSESVLSQAYSGKYTGSGVMGGLLLILGAALTWIGIRWRSRSMTVGGHLMSGG